MLCLAASSSPPSCRLPQLHHASHAAVVGVGQHFLELFAGQPLEVGQAVLVAGEVGLAGHDTALEEKDLFAAPGDRRAVLSDLGLDDVVGDGHAADDPRVHVGAGRLGQDAGSGLWKAVSQSG